MTEDNIDVETPPDNPNEEHTELPNRISRVTVGFSSMKQYYAPNNVFKAITYINIETTPRSSFNPLKMPRNYFNAAGLVDIEHDIEGWISKIRIHREGECIDGSEACTVTRRNPAPEKHGRAIGISIYSK